MTEKNNNNQNSIKNKKVSFKNTFPKNNKKDFSFLMESKYVQKWIKNVKSTNARLSTLHKYCEFLDKTPDELILEHHEDIKLDPKDQVEIGKNQLLAFFNYLTGEKNETNDKMIDKSISKNSARQYVFSKLMSFFKRNLVPITFQKGDIPKEDEGTKDKVWRKGEERIMVDNKKDCIKSIIDSFNDIRNRTIIHCKVSSGLDDIDLFNLKVEDYRKGYYPEYKICFISRNRIKNGEYYQTFFTSEACKMIDLYLEDRKRKEEKITNNSWLFVGNKRNNKTKKYSQLNPITFSEDLKNVCEKLDIKNVTSKSFRRWFNSELKRNGVDFEIVERMMGHKFGVSTRYKEVFEDPDAFAKIFIEKIEQYLIIGNGIRKISKLDKEVEKLKIDNEALRNEMVNMKEMMGEFVSALYFSSIDDGTKDPTDERKEFDPDKLKEVFEKYFKKSK